MATASEQQQMQLQAAGPVEVEPDMATAASADACRAEEAPTVCTAAAGHGPEPDVEPAVSVGAVSAALAQDTVLAVPPDAEEAPADGCRPKRAGLRPKADPLAPAMKSARHARGGTPKMPSELEPAASPEEHAKQIIDRCDDSTSPGANAPDETPCQWVRAVEAECRLRITAAAAHEAAARAARLEAESAASETAVSAMFKELEAAKARCRLAHARVYRAGLCGAEALASARSALIDAASRLRDSADAAGKEVEALNAANAAKLQRLADVKAEAEEEAQRFAEMRADAEAKAAERCCASVQAKDSEKSASGATCDDSQQDAASESNTTKAEAIVADLRMRRVAGLAKLQLPEETNDWMAALGLVGGQELEELARRVAELEDKVALERESGRCAPELSEADRLSTKSGHNSDASLLSADAGASIKGVQLAPLAVDGHDPLVADATARAADCLVVSSPAVPELAGEYRKLAEDVHGRPAYARRKGAAPGIFLYWSPNEERYAWTFTQALPGPEPSYTTTRFVPEGVVVAQSRQLAWTALPHELHSRRWDTADAVAEIVIIRA